MNMSGISSALQASRAAQAPPVHPQPAKPKAEAPAQDTVHISAAAKNARRAKPAEATETPAQTEQEAAAGDPQALAKLAREKSTL